MKTRKIIMIAILLFFVLSGCSKTDQQNIPSTDENSAVVDYTCIANPQSSQKIYVILKNYHGDYWKKVMEGISMAAKEVDKAVYLGGIDNETDIQGQISLMEQAVEQGADAILLAPADSTYLVESCKKVRKKRIPVVVIDSSINTSDYDKCFMTDNMEAGSLAAQEMLKLLKEKNYSEEKHLEIGIFLSSDTSQAMINRVSGFLEYWADYAPEQWEIAEDIFLNGGSVEKAQSDVEQLLEENKDIKGIFGCNNTSTRGISRTILNQERRDIVMVGFDLADETKDIIKKQDYHAVSLLQNQGEMGYEGIISLNALLQGEKSKQKFFDTGVTVIDDDYLMGNEVS